MKITVQQLRYLLKVAETGSISNAAKELSASHGTISEAVNQLEKELGFTVFNRSKHGITPTEKGIGVLAQASKVVESMDGFEAYYDSNLKPINHLVVSSQEFKFAVAAFNKVTNKLDTKKYEYSIIIKQFAKPIHDVYAGVADMGVIYLSDDITERRLAEIQELDLEFHDLFSAPIYAYLDREHPLASKKSITKEELATYPRFSFENFRYLGSIGQPQIGTFSGSRGHKVLAPDDLQKPDLIPLIADVNGYALWASLYEGHTPYERTVFVQVDTTDRMRIGYVTQRGAQLSELAQDFVREMKGFAPKKH